MGVRPSGRLPRFEDALADDLLFGLGKGLFDSGQAGSLRHGEFGDFFHICLIRNGHFRPGGGDEFCDQVLQQGIHAGVEFGFHERLVEQVVHRAADTCEHFFLQGLIG